MNCLEIFLSSWFSNKFIIPSVVTNLVQVRYFHPTCNMAHSKWEYVRKFETNNDKLLPGTWAVARIDGRGFHKFAKTHKWTRPNDLRGINLMNHAAKVVLNEFEDIILGYGQSDEYSFVFRRETEVFERRETKIITTLVSKFASAYVFHWSKYFPDEQLLYPPSFDGRIVLYPTDVSLRDYLCWRQADCHINNLYNTTFWNLVLKGNLTNNEAEKRLSGTLSGDKNEILFSQFGINYNEEPEVFRKGTVLVQKEKSPKMPRKHYMQQKDKAADHQKQASSAEDQQSKLTKIEERMESITELNCDIIGQKFWDDYPHLINPNATKSKSQPAR
ncbi:tRNA(His) guanylyltransferase isoform X2 [Folsomia candida]|uniref:tRNA(His) guanylyltransferase isoform X2 n=1 Tax=Folsomia candida TaxID=158441 RepID=UPI000B90243C|nr:tRNA(His) guanylyltransferase isoform X2 [Folsomia candida]